MDKTVCVKCQLEYRPEKIGIYVIEMFCTPPQPYVITDADLLKCPGCGNEVVARFGSGGVYHHQEEFSGVLEVARRSRHIVVRENNKIIAGDHVPADNKI